MSKKSNATKAGSLTLEFKEAAKKDEIGALAYMLMSSFGVMLSALMAVVERMLDLKDYTAIVMCLTAATQIRAHVTFVTEMKNDFKKKYPELIIDSDRDVGDIFNFGALHAMGHLFAHVTTHDLGRKILAKAGSCITGVGTSDSEAGKVNQEIAASWTTTDKALFNAWLGEYGTTPAADLNTLCATLEAKSTAFKASIKAKA